MGGFNCCVVCYGERAAGKTTTMFGLQKRDHERLVSSNNVDIKRELSDDSWDSLPEAIIRDGGIAVGILRELFYSSKRYSRSDNMNKNNRGKITIALSAWMLRGQLVIE